MEFSLVLTKWNRTVHHRLYWQRSSRLSVNFLDLPNWIIFYKVMAVMLPVSERVCSRVLCTYHRIDRRCIGSISNQKGLFGDAPIKGVNGIWARPTQPSNMMSLEAFTHFPLGSIIWYKWARPSICAALEVPRIFSIIGTYAPGAKGWYPVMLNLR